MRRAMIYLLVGVVVVGAFFFGRRFFRKPPPDAAVPVELVQRQNITVTVDATGTVEPINLVEVKSKASGQIIRMPVEVGSVVKPGDLLAQIDSSDVRNQYDQAYATLQAAQAKVEVSGAQRKRADALFDQQIATADEHETAILDFSNAQALVVAARANLDIARKRLADATVLAPIAGTVLNKPVSVGQVISSATSNVSGGTTLLQMADLRRIRLRTLVNETDVGSIRSGQAATVQVDAYPKRTFQGLVEKIEPQAVVQQSVTMFPVLVSISNEEGLLLPGMNGEVTMLVEERDGVVAVPLDAVRTMRELPVVAEALGMNSDSIRAQVKAQFASRAGGQGPRGAGSDSTSGRRRRPGRVAGDTGSPGRPGADAGSPGRDRQAQIVFVKTARGLEVRVVRLGLTNFDFAEVLDGVSEGDQVALLNVAELQAQRSQNLSRIRQRMSANMPGVGSAPSTGGGGAGTGGGGAGGGRRGGP